MNRVTTGIALFLFSQCLFLHAANAESCPPIRGNTIVFGGLGSKTAQMNLCYPNFLALAHEDGPKFIGCLAQQINASKGQKFVIAGLSSGSEDAEDLARLIRAKNQIRLVLLDGYAYTMSQRGADLNPNTACWYAQNTNKKIQGPNAVSMQNPQVCPQPARTFTADWCETTLCLHLSLVNLEAPSLLSRNNVLTAGLANCRGNLDWLKENLTWLKE